MSEQVELIVEGKSVKLPVIEGTEKEKAIDIAKLRSETGYITYDAGFKNTGSTQSSVTFLDGELGILSYRGYPIDQLAEKSNFIEVAYLLIYGELPTSAQLSAFENEIKDNSEIPANIETILNGFPSDAHPMGVLGSLLSALTAFYPESIDANPSPELLHKLIVRIIGQLPTLVATTYRKSKGLPVLAPRKDLDYCSNFYYMMFAEAGKEFKADQVIADALNKLFILHADHEQNCSTSTVRIVGSSQASLYSSLAAGTAALWGPLHGGANQAVIEMLEEIKTDGGDTAKFILKAKDKNDTFRLMGFGHRVYKNFDPRAKIIKVACDQILGKLGVSDPVLAIAKGLEEVALSDQYFVDRKLYPNVDFYSGIIYRALGIPTEYFTVMFALGRLPGWIAQWKEMRADNEPIGRPRQVYIGATERNYVDKGNR
jgi:citrate synthase